MKNTTGRFFEEFSEGEKFVTPRRTVTEADIVAFAGLSGDYNVLHTDEEFAKETIFGRRIAHGLLVLSISSGLNMRLGVTEGTVIAFAGLEWRFTAPVFIGDTICMELEVESMRETKKPDRGLIIFACKVIKQDGTVCQEGTRTMLIKRKPVTGE